jgi:hypothetical protein
VPRLRRSQNALLLFVGRIEHLVEAWKLAEGSGSDAIVSLERATFARPLRLAQPWSQPSAAAP